MTRNFYIIIFFFLFSSCSQKKSDTKLVVLMVVDHMRADHLHRFNSLFTSGFRWLIDNGIIFDSTFHNHAYTLTGPGHYSIGSGRYPNQEGVIGNSYFDRTLNKKVNCVEDVNASVVGGEGDARSYAQYDSTGLGDWIKKSDSLSKVFSIAGKDRAAIFLAGKNPNLAIYYNYHNRFITSSYYADSLPVWLDYFNQNLNLISYSDSLWEKSLSDSLYLTSSRADSFFGEVDSYNSDIYSPSFPIGIDPGVYPGDVIMGRPWFEKIITELAIETVKEENLGLDNHPDLLSIGFSSMDWIIHEYGPFSQEAMDAFLKLDNYLGSFINSLDSIVGLENIEFILTSDHGGLPIPEHLILNGSTGGRINKNEIAEAYQWIDEEISERFDDNLFYRHGVNYYFDIDKLKKRNLEIDDPGYIVKKYLSLVEGIDTVFYKYELLNSLDSNKIIKRLVNNIHLEKSPDVFGIVERGYTFRGPRGTSHGSPYDYDTHVPLVFSRYGRSNNIIKTNTKTVDIAPTITNLLGINHPSSIDGDVLHFDK